MPRGVCIMQAEEKQFPILIRAKTAVVALPVCQLHQRGGITQGEHIPGDAHDHATIDKIDDEPELVSTSARSRVRGRPHIQGVPGVVCKGGSCSSCSSGGFITQLVV